MVKRFRIGQHTLLRELTEEDATTLYAVINDNRAHLRAWLSWVDRQQGAVDSLEFIRRSATENEQGRALTLGIAHQGAIVGVIGFHEIDQDNELASIGYWIAADHQGKGIVTKSCRRLIDYAFHDLGLNKVMIRVAKQNRRSRNVAQRLGLVEDNTLKQSEWLYDHYVDLVAYVLVAGGRFTPG